MNTIVDTNKTEESLTEVEVAAVSRRGEKPYANPLDYVRKGFLRVVLNAHPLWRTMIMGTILNDAMNKKFETGNMAGVLNYDLSGYSEPVTAGRLREHMQLAPGNGANKPIRVIYEESLTNIPDEIISDFMSVLPKDVKKGLSFTEYYNLLSDLGVSDTVAAALTPSYNEFNTRFLEPMEDVMDFTLSVNRSVFNETNETGNLDFQLTIILDSSVYKELVKSDDFSPYLVYLWANNALKITREVDTIVDPRYASRNQKMMQKFGNVRPKVNDNHFGIWGDGSPIWIPKQLDVTDQFIKDANACIDENGVFQRSMLTEKYNRGNQIIYVDWVNDIMAYTTSTGLLESKNLANVSPFDPVTEYNFLSTGVRSPAIFKMMRALSNSFGELDDASEAEKFTDDPEVKDVLQRFTPVQIYQDLISSNADISLLHMAGGQLEDFDPEEDKRIILRLKAVKCLFKLLRAKMAKDPSALKIPSSNQSEGIFYRMRGLEYVLRVMEKYDADKIESLRQEWVKETQKWKVDLSKRSFDVPNIVLHPGFQGLLPHQGRIISCAEKTPSMLMMPVQTGGGKTVLNTLVSIFGIKNLRVHPMIMTKGNLIKGTVTEINEVTQGKINAFPLTPIVLRRLKRRAGIKTFKQFLEWYKSLPPNTILVSSYTSLASRRKIYEDLDIINGFGDKPVFTTQFLLIIKLLGIRMVNGDESHMIKNPDSARSRNSYAVFSHADARSISSGTMVSNTVKDLVGQARAISPFIFGDSAEEFCDNYGIANGLIKSDENATLIKSRLKQTVAYHEATREDWSYMLPIKDDEILFARMTPLQTEWYNALMTAAYDKLMAEVQNKGKKSKLLDEDGEDDEDEEDEEDDVDEDDEDAEENALIAKLQIHLQAVEAFLVAPDESEAYVNWEKKPTGEDLVSPKVRLADSIIDQHLAMYGKNLSSNKVIVFGWNKVASKHFIRHSKYGKKALHYTAGDEAVTLQFTDDPNAWLMVADENSVREGHNWQMTSLILRQQAVWAPGDHEQAVARMYRPDPRGKYNRESVRHVWLMTETDEAEVTLDGVKMARLASKFVSNARLTYEGRHEWKMVSREFDDLKMLKMKLEVIFDTKKDDMLPYFGAWKTFVSWENNINRLSRRKLAYEIEKAEAEKGNNVTLIDKKGEITDINQFIKYAMYEVRSTKDIPGSKRVFVPWVLNSIPPDPNKWGWNVMGRQEVPVGTVVYTEFGPAIITAVSKRAVKVRIFNGQVIGLKRGDVMLVNPNKYKKFAKIVQDVTAWRAEALHPFGVKGAKKVAKEEIEDDEEVIESLDDAVDIDEDEDDRVEVDVFAGIINGWPALIIDEDIDELKRVKGWNRVDPFTTVSFRSWTAAEKFIELLDAKAHIPDAVYERLMEEMADIRDGKQMKLGRQIDYKRFRNFFVDQRKKLGVTKKGIAIVNPYWIVNEFDVKLAFDTDSHNAGVISWLVKAKSSVPGVTKVVKNSAMWINTFTTIAEAIRDMEALMNVVAFDEAALREDLADVKQEITALRRVRARPSV